MLCCCCSIAWPTFVCVYFTEYPWITISDHEDTNFGLKKWFFLSDYLQMLDKSVLYGMLHLVFLQFYA